MACMLEYFIMPRLWKIDRNRHDYSAYYMPAYIDCQTFDQFKRPYIRLEDQRFIGIISLIDTW